MNQNPDMNDDKDAQSKEIEWRDGDMPYSKRFGDYYYSKSDGRLECDHVFIQGNDLKTRFQTDDQIIVGELGFGTGLNFLETARQFKALSSAYAQLDFHSFEINPLSGETISKALSIWPEIKTEREQLINIWPDEFKTKNQFSLDKNITLHLHIGDVNETIRELTFKANAWFLDGFSPARNKAMWSLELMEEITRLTAENGTFSSYTAAGWVRRNLIEAGFDVKKTNGYAGKRDMIYGMKKQAIV